MRYHGVYPKIAVVIYLNEKKWCQSRGLGVSRFQNVEVLCTSLLSTAAAEKHQACLGSWCLRGSGFIIFIYRSEFFEAKVTWHILNLCFLFFSLDSLTFREATYSQRRFQLEWWLIAGMGNKWITLSWWKITMFGFKASIPTSITPKNGQALQALQALFYSPNPWCPFPTGLWRKRGGRF